MKVKIKVNPEDLYKSFIESSKRKDINIVIEGEPFSEYKFNIGDTVFVQAHEDDHSSRREGETKRILPARWGKIKDTNINSPKKIEEGVCYFVERKNGFGGWEEEEHLEMITH